MMLITLFVILLIALYLHQERVEFIILQGPRPKHLSKDKLYCNKNSELFFLNINTFSLVISSAYPE